MVASRALGGFTMSDNSSFRLTFHVSHPAISAAEIVKAFNLPIRFSQSVGEPRKTKTGKKLDGVYKCTNVSFCLHDNPLKFDDVEVGNLIRDCLEKFDADYIDLLAASGGACDFLLGIFSNENVMFELDYQVLGLLSSARISMKYDFYGGDE